MKELTLIGHALKRFAIDLKNKLVKVVLIVIVIALAFYSGRLMAASNSPISSTIIEPGSMVTEASYIIFKDGSTYYARNGKTGAIDFFGNDTSAVINSAVASLNAEVGGLIFIKEGIYELSEEILIDRRNVALIGSGKATELRTTQANKNGIVVRGIYVNVILSDFFVSTSVTKANSTAAIRLNSAFSDRNVIENIWITNHHEGILIENNTSGVWIDRCHISGSVSKGIVVNNGIFVYVSNTICYGTLPQGRTGVGLHIMNGESVFVRDSQFMNCSYGILCDPAGTNVTCRWLRFYNVAADCCRYTGFAFSTVQGGWIEGVYLTDCWACSNGVNEDNESYGLRLVGVDTAQVIGGQYNLNKHWGIELRNDGVKTCRVVTITGAHVLANSNKTDGGYSGIIVRADVSDFAIIGCYCRSYVLGWIYHWQKHGIEVESGSSDRFRIIGNDCTNNDPYLPGLYIGNVTGNDIEVAHNIQ